MQVLNNIQIVTTHHRLIPLLNDLTVCNDDYIFSQLSKFLFTYFIDVQFPSYYGNWKTFFWIVNLL